MDALAEAGFDIAHVFDARAAARHDGLGWLADAGRRGILIGNTRELWPRFVAARDQLAGEPHPLERYTERAIAGAFPEAQVFYSHRRYAGAFLPFQRLAVAVGLAALAPTQLLVHPIYGPWFGLRAVALDDGEPVARSPIAKPCRCDDGCPRALEAALQGSDWRAWLAVREACCLRAWRYGDDQIHYHYTKTWR